jgi:hypothetical protein
MHLKFEKFKFTTLFVDNLPNKNGEFTITDITIAPIPDNLIEETVSKQGRNPKLNLKYDKTRILPNITVAQQFKVTYITTIHNIGKYYFSQDSLQNGFNFNDTCRHLGIKMTITGRFNEGYTDCFPLCRSIGSDFDSAEKTFITDSIATVLQCNYSDEIAIELKKINSYVADFTPRKNPTNKNYHEPHKVGRSLQDECVAAHVQRKLKDSHVSGKIDLDEDDYEYMISAANLIEKMRLYEK